MAGMAKKFNWLEWLIWLEMAGSDQTWLEFQDTDKNVWKCLEMTRNGWNGMKWLDIVGNC